MTRDEKVQKYRKGLYRVPAPPVCTVWWNEYSWIKYIDKHGTWLTCPDDPNHIRHYSKETKKEKGGDKWNII